MTNKLTFDSHGWCKNAKRYDSPHFNSRPKDIDLLIIHGISLPCGQFGNSYIYDLFLGQLDESAHESFCGLGEARVSSHFFIPRDGALVQFVATEQRAWHAGVSVFNGVENCNDYSLGIELEGVDNMIYTDKQYDTLVNLTRALMAKYPKINLERIVAHSDVAPGRKTDPGEAFNWEYFKQQLI